METQRWGAARYTILILDTSPSGRRIYSMAGAGRVHTAMAGDRGTSLIAPTSGRAQTLTTTLLDVLRRGIRGGPGGSGGAEDNDRDDRRVGARP